MILMIARFRLMVALIRFKKAYKRIEQNIDRWNRLSERLDEIERNGG